MPGITGPTQVQSLTRAVDLLDDLADAGGRASLSELAATSGLPAPTVHRLLGTLIARGHVRREAGRRYALGPRLVRLGDVAARVLGDGVRPILAELVDATGESATLARLDGDVAVYLAQVPSPHPMRMVTEVGRRVPLHATGVGKALLSGMERSAVEDLLRRSGTDPGSPATTTATTTATEPAALVLELEDARHGYVVDDGEQEVGVRCVAAAVPGAPTPCAVSVSGPSARLLADDVARVGALVRDAAARLAAQLAAVPDRSGRPDGSDGSDGAGPP